MRRRTTDDRRLFLVLLFLALLLFASDVQAQDLDLETFRVASALQESGEHAAAAQLYEQLLIEGYADVRLRYNLGNAYYQAGDYGNAILNYRRVLLTNPRDGDVRHNLNLARDRVIDQFNRSDLNFFESAVQVSNWITLTEMAIVSLLIWFAWVAARLIYRHPRNERQRTAAQSALIGLTALLILSLVAVGNRVYSERSSPPAVVVAEQTAVLASPALGEPVFTLHSGAEVNITGQESGWVEVTLPGGELQGWISAETIQPVIQSE